MKLKKISTYKSKLIRLQLLKSKTYKLNKSDNRYMKLEYIELHLKKALQIIYDYHFNNKKIFFVGVPKKVQQKFTKTLQRTQHLFIPESTWIIGILSNRTSIFKYIHQQVNSNIKTKKNNNLKSLFEIQKKPDLIVLFNEKSESKALQEANKLRIPTLVVTNSFRNDNNALYRIPGSFHFLNKKLDNVFFILLNSIFKKLNN